MSFEADRTLKERSNDHMFGTYFVQANPFIEKLNSVKQFREVSKDTDLCTQVMNRETWSAAIAGYLLGVHDDILKNVCFASIQSIITSADDSRYARMLLYIPLAELENAPPSFKDFYREQIPSLLNFEDVREDFNIGDAPASDSEPAKVVKIVHMLPWLKKAGIVNDDYIDRLLDETDRRLSDAKPTLAKSFCDLLALPDVLRVQMEVHYPRIRSLRGRLSKGGYLEQEPSLTKYREQWLKEKAEGNSIQFSNITGPFSENVNMRQLDFLATQYSNTIWDGEILIVGGSRIKGYSDLKKDFDVKIYDPHRRKIALGGINLDYGTMPNPNMAYLVFDTLWMGIDDVLQHQITAASQYFAPSTAENKIQCIMSLEQDLLQYRLMHKGFPYAYDDLSAETRDFSGIDGASAFWDDRYRTIATVLYAKYCFIPQN